MDDEQSSWLIGGACGCATLVIGPPVITLLTALAVEVTWELRLQRVIEADEVVSGAFLGGIVISMVVGVLAVPSAQWTTVRLRRLLSRWGSGPSPAPSEPPA